MVENKKKNSKKLNFKYKVRRVKKEKITKPLCPDFKKKEFGDSCALSMKCKNATYVTEFLGTCYGGAKETEIRDRKRRMEAKI